MGKYRDVDCPICKKPLENGETIVICPDCGAPYHKSCVDTVGKCIRDDLHQAGKSWEMPTREKQYAADEEKRCSRCGTMNPVGGLFCVVCGNQMNQREGEENKSGPMGAGNRMGQQIPPFQMPYDPYNTPFGGVSPDDSIEEIPVRDWAIFVGQNTAYFIPKFKEYTERRKHNTFNFAAMLLGGIYFLYRKMFLWGGLLLAFRILITLPALLLQFDVMRLAMGGTALYTSDTLVLLNNICFGLNLVFMGLCGTFANKMYMSHCKSRIRQLQQQFTEDQTYRMKLTESGSVSRTVIVVVVAGYFLLSMAMTMVLMQSLL